MDASFQVDHGAGPGLPTCFLQAAKVAASIGRDHQRSRGDRRGEPLLVDDSVPPTLLLQFPLPSLIGENRDIRHQIPLSAYRESASRADLLIPPVATRRTQDRSERAHRINLPLFSVSVR
jgi:hypothetical protein